MTPTIDEKRLRKVLGKNFKLLYGGHSPDGKMCVMEAVAYVAGEPWSAAPKCASPVLTKFCMAWNDGMNDEDRQQLKPFIRLLTLSEVAA